MVGIGCFRATAAVVAAVVAADGLRYNMAFYLFAVYEKETGLLLQRCAGQGFLASVTILGC